VTAFFHSTSTVNKQLPYTLILIHSFDHTYCYTHTHSACLAWLLRKHHTSDAYQPSRNTCQHRNHKVNNRSETSHPINSYTMSRELISSSSYPLYNSTPSSSMKSSQSRIPVKAKRAPLGERIDNHDHTTPRQHLVKSVKSVIRPRIVSTKSTASPSKSSAYRPSPRAAVQGSPSSSIVSSPAGANVSRPGHTPHPRRSSVGLAFLGHDVSMLMDTTRLDFVSDTDDSEGDEPSNNMLVRRGVMGPGRLMTPANSQESQVSSLATGVLADM
jgi:hypothetical protein